MATAAAVADAAALGKVEIPAMLRAGYSRPFALGVAVPGYDGAAGLAFVPGDPVLENLRRFGVYTLLTSTGSWDTGRAVTTAVALVVLGPAVLATLRRAVRRATVVRVGPADAGAAAGADR